jgi:3-hydroxybutyryl-CoA dehydrogenase
MTNHPFQTVSVIGAGTMGAGIAQVLAVSGITVCLYDINEAAVAKGQERIQTSLNEGLSRGKLLQPDVDTALSRVTTTTALEQVAQAELVIEAAPESMVLKKELFQKLDLFADPDVVLVSNTSSLSISALAGVTQRPERVAGLHFFNPVPAMKLVEVIRGHQTQPEIIENLKALVLSFGKTPVVCLDTPGFIVNRVARPFYGEAFRMLAEDISGEGFEQSVKTIDGVLKSAGGFKMGPFELMDLIGLDVNFAVTQSVYDATFGEPRYRPHPIQQKMVASGLLGKKSKKGFYAYE